MRGCGRGSDALPSLVAAPVRAVIVEKNRIPFTIMDHEMMFDLPVLPRTTSLEWPGIVLRIETTTNDESFFKHHRRVEHRDSPPTRELAPVKKSIYSLIDLREILLGCNRRYLAHLSALDDFSAGVRALGRLTQTREVDGKTVKGINFFETSDSALLHALQNPRVNIAGIRRADLLPELQMFSPNRLSRHLRRLRDIGVIKRVAGTYRYYLTKAGRAATAAAERLTETIIIPAMI